MSPNEELYNEDYYHDYAGDTMRWRASYRQRQGLYTRLIDKLRRAHPAIKKVAEIGCGAGQFTYSITRIFGNDIYIRAGDISEHAICIAKRQLSDSKRTEFMVLDAQNIPLPSQSFDLVVSLDVVEHLEKPEAFFSEARRLLSPNGLLLFSTPNPQSFGARKKINAFSAKNDFSVWFAYRDPTHINIRYIECWREVCRKNGFERVTDGTDFLWDIPYFKNIPLILQKLFFVGSKVVLSAIFGFLPWRWGENYYGIWRKTAEP
jgi:SAM-dependent methyltransferase